MKFLTIFIAIVSPFWTWAQVGAGASETSRILKQPDSLLIASPPKALLYADTVLRSKAAAQNICEVKALALSLKGRALLSTGRWEEALQVLEQAVSLNRQCKNDQPLAMSLTATALCMMHDWESEAAEVVQPLDEALGLAEKVRDTMLAAKICTYLAKTWGDSQQPAKALAYNLQCESFLRGSPRRDLRGINRVGLGNRLLELYHANDDSTSLRQATEYYSKAITDLQPLKDSSSVGALADALNGMGGAKLYADDLAEAERYFKESLATSRQVKYLKGAATALYNLSLLAECRNEFQIALDTLEAAHRIAQDYPPDKRDELMKHQLTGSIYEYQKALLKSQHKARKLEQCQYAMMSGAILLSLSLLAGWFFYRQKMRNRQLLQEEQQKTQLKEMENKFQEREITFVREKMDAAATERISIARKLHDDVGGKLISTKWGLETILKDLPEDSELAQKLAENLRQQEESYQAARAVSHQLKRSIGHWWEYLEQLCARLGNGHTKIEFSTHNLDDSVTGEIGEAARLTVQELVINALKSAKATEISVQIDRVDNLLSIFVRDNGVGFDTAAKASGIGLSNIRERIEEELGGSFSIDSTIGEGTSAFVDIPLGHSDALDKNLLKFDDNDE